MTSLKKYILQLLTYTVLLIGLVGLSGCGSSEVDPGEELLSCALPLIPDSTGSSCVEPPAFFCAPPTVPNATNDGCVVGVDPNAPMPVVFPSANEAILFYKRDDATNVANDPEYDGWRLHTWNNEECDAYAAESIAPAWNNGLEVSGFDPNYGAYWILSLKEGYGECGNFIIHIGTDDDGKEFGGGDWKMNLIQDDPDFTRMNWTFQGVPAVFEFPVVSLGEQPLKIEGFAAHWIDATTLVWDIDAAVTTEVRLHYSMDAGIEADENSNVSGSTLSLTETALTAEQLAMYPQFEGWAAFAGDWTADDAKGVVKAQLVAVAYDEEGATEATGVQAAKVLDAIYTSADNDADEAQLGVVYEGDNISVSVWAPTAQDVKLKLYDADKNETSTQDMTEDSATGIWSYSGDSSLDRIFYRFELTVFHPQNNAIETIESTDPYSVSLSTNGMHSQFVNLADADLKPQDWDSQTIPTIVDPEDAVIYEGHIRDFSVRDDSTTETNRGKYLAFTEVGSVPMQHLSSLATNGLTHFHMLPANDIATINEDPARIVDINNTVADLCQVNQEAAVCDVESDDATLLSVFESYTPYSEDAQQLANDMRGYDSFNWGYDPKHFTVPDGIYASDADGVARILEMRGMIQSLHETGLRVVLDVVYNHTNSAGLFDNSVFDKIVPGYYHRRDLTSGSVTQSTCCNDTELDHRMMDKFMVDSLLVWTQEYKFDGFRFDIMSHGSVEQMLAARDAVRVVDPDNYFYGEGWFRDDGRANQANQENMAGTEISTFNDRLRDAVRNAALFNDGEDLNPQDIVKLGMAGTLANYVLEGSGGNATTGSSFFPSAYALDPADVVNYVSKHDNETLWDQLQYNLPIGMTTEDRVRSANIAASIPLVSQGIPFLQLGGDLLRSKSMDRNTYDAGDWFNYVDFTMATNNWNVGLPLEQDNGGNWESIVGISSNPLTQTSMSDIMYSSSVFKEFLSIRRDSKLFRLTTEADIIGRVGFHNLGSRQEQGLIVMSIDDGIDLVDLDPANDALVVVVNGSDEEQSHTIPTAEGFELHPTLVNSVDPRMASASYAQGTGEGTFTVPARTLAVFVKPQGAAQGTGLSAYATSGAPDVVPYGDTVVYLRGGMNDWGTDDAFDYKGDGVYEVAVNLAADTEYFFKVASEDWSTVNLGAESAADVVVTEGVDKPIVTSNDNLSFTPSADADYLFSVDASDTDDVVLNVVNEEPFVGTTVYLRGSMNDWGTGTPFNYDGGRIYSVTTTLSADTYAFKVASEDWATVNFGGISEDAADTTVELGIELPLGQADNNNLNLDITTDSDYVFIFDMVNLDPKLRVFNQEFFNGTPVFLRGGMNGWGTDDELAYDGVGNYTVDIALTANTYEFKVASEDWAAVNFGAQDSDSTSVELGVAKDLFSTNDNLSLEITADGTYRFTVTGPDGSKPSVTVEGL